jgi:hypothetical protein
MKVRSMHCFVTFEPGPNAQEENYWYAILIYRRMTHVVGMYLMVVGSLGILNGEDDSTSLCVNAHKVVDLRYGSITLKPDWMLVLIQTEKRCGRGIIGYRIL